MSEPASAASAGALTWKVIGGAAGVVGFAATLAAIVVMCATPPRSRREWAVGLISTVISSLAGGATVILKFGLLSWVDPVRPETLYFALVALGGLIFSCGLPGWAVVRALFTWIERRRDAGIDELAADARKIIGGGS